MYAHCSLRMPGKASLNLACTMQAYRNFRILRVVLAVAAGAFAAASMSTAVLSGFSVRAPALLAAAALTSGALATIANNFVRLLTFKPYEHYKR